MPDPPENPASSARATRKNAEPVPGSQGGLLYLIGSPIGNLEDITLRALRVLKEVDLIACEDTRQTQKLLNHYEISAPTISYHEHNEAARAAELTGRLQQGIRLALVTDAGMPGISDPGYRLVSAAIQQGIPVVPVPGASAFLSALVASGLTAASFSFGGFLPARRSQRRKLLEELRHSAVTQVFYESPHRILESLEDIVEVLGTSRPLVVAREVTKLHEEFLRGTAAELLEVARSRELKGEMTLLIGEAVESSQQSAPAVSLRSRVDELMSAGEMDEKSALKRAARERGISKSAAYRELQQSKSGLKGK